MAELAADRRRRARRDPRAKRLFDGGAIPAGLELTGSKATPSGVVIATYRTGADIKYGSFAN